MKTRIEPILQNDNTSADAIYGKDEVSCNLRGKGNDNQRPTPVLRGDTSCFDVICEKDKVSYNHTGKGSDIKIPGENLSNRPNHILAAKFIGNRRLRFAVVLNLNRCRYPSIVKQKKVVDSILQHIESAGGRFLEKVSTREDRWFKTKSFSCFKG
jgi:hypothetical protein